MESKHAGKAEEPGDSYVPPGWIVCYACTTCQDELTVTSVCIVSIIRVPYIASISSPASLADPSWSLTYAAIWTIVELNIAIVSACLPILRPLFVRVFHGRYTPAIAEGTFQERRTGKCRQDVKVDYLTRVWKKGRFCDMGATIDTQPLAHIAGAPGSESFLWEQAHFSSERMYTWNGMDKGQALR